MKTVTTLLLMSAVITMLIALTGCDPEKPGGGGLLQPYSSSTGQYK